MKFEQNWLSGFRGEVEMLTNARTDGRMDDGQKSNHYRSPCELKRAERMASCFKKLKLVHLLSLFFLVSAFGMRSNI